MIMSIDFLPALVLARAFWGRWLRFARKPSLFRLAVTHVGMLAGHGGMT
jgi:hypothetical protein